MGGTGRNPTDRSKRGTKRSLLVDGNGIPLAVAVNDAKRHEVTLVGATLEETMAHRPTPADDEPQNVCLDKAYDSVKVEALLLEWGYTAHIRVHGEKKRGQAKHTGKPGQAMGSLKKLQLDGPISPVVDKVGETNL